MSTAGLISAVLAVASAVGGGVRDPAPFMPTPAQAAASFAEPVELWTPSGVLRGTLVLPPHSCRNPTHVPVTEQGVVRCDRVPVALIVSGGTRDEGSVVAGSSNFPALRRLAEAVALEGVAVLRYDLRGVGESSAATPAHTFDAHVDDAVAWLEMLRADTRFAHRVVIAHADAALVGIRAAALGHADALVTINARALSLGDIIRQAFFDRVPSPASDMGEQVLASLEGGQSVASVPDEVVALTGDLFRPNRQAYLISVLEISPLLELAAVSVPVQLVQSAREPGPLGAETDALLRAQPGARLAVIEMDRELRPWVVLPSGPRAGMRMPESRISEILVAELMRFIHQTAAVRTFATESSLICHSRVHRDAAGDGARSARDRIHQYHL